MSEPPHPRRDPLHVAQRRLWAALGLSVLVHLALVWKIPQVTPLRPSDEAKERGPLIVQLTPPPGAPAPRPQESAPRPREPVPRAREPVSKPQPRAAPRVPEKALERSRPPPPVIARSVPAPDAPSVPRETPPPATAPPAPRPPADLAAYVEARRRARGETPAPPRTPEVAAPNAPAEDENARANRIAAANLGLGRKPTFGQDTRKGGGVFQITRRGYDYAEFLFYGWNKDISRNTTQLIEVRKGSESNIEVAIVRRMIAIIREHEDGDFLWESPRLNRTVTLSARPRDEAGLQAFLMREFFEDPRRPAVAR
jgi:hypothetical protein